MSERKPRDLISLSFDKRTAAGNVKYIGACLYFRVQNLCLGLIHYTGFCGACGAEQVASLLKERLNVFDISLSEVTFFTTDIGSDFQRVARLEDKFTFPCLAHVIHLIAKRVVFKCDESSGERGDDDDDQSDDEFLPSEDQMLPVIRRVRAKVNKIRKTSIDEDRLKIL